MQEKKKKAKAKTSRTKVMNRYFVVIALAFLCGILIIGRMCQLTFLEGDYWKKVSQRFVRENVMIAPQRGNILAADGQMLATSLPQYRLYMDFMAYDKDSVMQRKAQTLRDSIICADTLRVIPGLLNRRKQIIPEATQQKHIDSCRRVLTALCEGMHKIFPEDIDAQQFRKHLLEGREKKSKHWLLYKKKISYIQYCQVKKLPFFKLGTNRSGFHTQDYPTRQNPYGKLAARTVGDLYGEKDSARCGLELSYDSLLRGKPGYCHRQKVLNNFVSIYDKMPEDGYDIRTTLDINMQDIVEKTLGEHLKEISADFGICAVMEVATGDVKAMSSLDRLADGSYFEISNRAVSLLQEPGSVFKGVSFMVGLDQGAFTLNTGIETFSGEYNMYGAKMKDSNWSKGGNGYINAEQVFEKSSNIGTSRLIDQYYHNKPQEYVKAVYRTGIHDDLQLPIPGYAKPNIREPKKDKTGKYWINWSNTALPWMSMGYETQIPPISTLAFYNGIANNGKMMYPRFVQSIEKNGEVIRELPPRVVREHMCKPSTIRDLHKILRGVVVKGTGKQCGSKNFSVSGKTGTAQVWTKGGRSNKYFVTFVGFFPSEHPKYSMIVSIQKAYPAYGGSTCGPVFKKVAESIMAQNMETNLSLNTDSVNTLQPIVRPGNVRATHQSLNALGIDCRRPANSDMAWGSASQEGHSYKLNVEKTKNGIMPNLKGYGLRDAVFRLEKIGLKVSARGSGRVVQQSIAPGTAVKKGTHVAIVLSSNGKIPLEEPAAPAQQPTDPAQKPAAPAPQPAAPAPPAGQLSQQPANPQPKPTQKTDSAATIKKKNQS